jgi:hypothetical protein
MAQANIDLVARRKTKMKWKREVERVTKQKNLRPEKALNREI